MGGLGKKAPSMEVTKKQYKRFLRKGETMEVTALECIVTRSTWPGERLATKVRKRYRCGGRWPARKLWICGDDANIDHEAARKRRNGRRKLERARRVYGWENFKQGMT